jgi:hypothetical protein
MRTPNTTEPYKVRAELELRLGSAMCVVEDRRSLDQKAPTLPVRHRSSSNSQPNVSQAARSSHTRASNLCNAALARPVVCGYPARPFALLLRARQGRYDCRIVDDVQRQSDRRSRCLFRRLVQDSKEIRLAPRRTRLVGNSGLKSLMEPMQRATSLRVRRGGALGARSGLGSLQVVSSRSVWAPIVPAPSRVKASMNVPSQAGRAAVECSWWRLIRPFCPQARQAIGARFWADAKLARWSFWRILPATCLCVCCLSTTALACE